MAKAKTNQNPEKEKAYVATVRTALAGPEDGIMRKLPQAIARASLGGIVNYLTDRKQLAQEEVITARSLEDEMRKTYTLTANGKAAKPDENAMDYFAPSEHKGVKYMAIVMEIASVQEGGLVYKL